MRILFFGTYDAHRHPRVRVLQEGFRDLGDEVIERNAPLGLDTAARVRMLRRPWLVVLLGSRLATAWWTLRRMGRHLPKVDATIVGYMGHWDVRLARRLRTPGLLVLDHLAPAAETGVDRGVGSKVILRSLRRIDERAVRAADIVVVDTEEHLMTLPADVRSLGVVVPVGAPKAWFQEPPRSWTPPLKVVFFGLYTPLQGAPVIGRAIGSLSAAPIRFTMVGHGQDLAETRKAAASNPNVDWIRWVDAERLPELVSAHDVCLGIFGTGGKAMRVVPNKVFQGAAAGCALVTSDTGPQRRTLGVAATYVPPNDSTALAATLSDMASDPERVRLLRIAAYEHARLTFRPSVVVEGLRRHLITERRP